MSATESVDINEPGDAPAMVVLTEANVGEVATSLSPLSGSLLKAPGSPPGRTVLILNGAAVGYLRGPHEPHDPVWIDGDRLYVRGADGTESVPLGDASIYDRDRTSAELAQWIADYLGRI